MSAATATAVAAPAEPAAGFRLSPRLMGWLGPLAVTALAAYLRFHNLGKPHAIVFDETYYAHDAYSLLNHGVEMDKNFANAGFVVHPPLGKWMIAGGEWLFGGHAAHLKDGIYPANAFGWRFSSALVGSLAVLMIARIARRMTGSTLLGCFAGFLLAMCALEFVQSRISMLDIFLMFWIVAAFGCLVLYRDTLRARLASGATLWPARGWLLAAGVCAGAATATKWSGLYDIAAFLLLALAWTVSARRGVARETRPIVRSLRRDTLPLALTMVVAPAVVYASSWIGWFLGNSKTAYDHDLYLHGQGTLGHFFAVIHGWLKYHQQIYHFHATLHAHHPYASKPWGWLVLARPVAYYYSSPKFGQIGCHATGGCSREILGIGTPAIFWATIPALFVVLYLWARNHDWRAGGVLLGFIAGYLPWLAFPDRTMFLFYVLPAVPFMVLALTLTAGLALGAPGARGLRRELGAAGVGVYAAVVALNFWYLYPVLAAGVLPYANWHARMWFGSWI